LRTLRPLPSTIDCNGREVLVQVAVPGVLHVVCEVHEV